MKAALAVILVGCGAASLAPVPEHAHATAAHATALRESPRVTRSLVRRHAPKVKAKTMTRPKLKAKVKVRATPTPYVSPLPATVPGFTAWRESYAARTVLACESHGTYNEANGDGAWQIIPSTWRAWGGGVYSSIASLASPGEQDAVAYKGWLMDGWSPWSSDWADGCFQKGGW